MPQENPREPALAETGRTSIKELIENAYKEVAEVEKVIRRAYEGPVRVIYGNEKGAA